MRYWECEGLTTDAACTVLYTLASKIHHETAIVEVGVFRGKSLLALAEGSAAGQEAPVYGIDPWTLTRPSKAKYKSDDTFLYVRQAVHDSPASHLITLRKGFGVTEAAQWHGPKVGLLYIDADHRYQPVLDDVSSWAPHLAPRAIIAFDDCHSDFPGVIDAVADLIHDGRLTGMFMATDRLAVATWHG